MDSRAAQIERILAWLYRDELRHSRVIWRLEYDARLDPPWPYRGLWWDPAGALLLDLRGHPRLDGEGPPWFQAAAQDPAALELLAALWLPREALVLANTDLRPAFAALGEVTVDSTLDVYVCPPGALGDAALPYAPTRLTTRHRALVAAADWRPEDLAAESDEAREGVRWAIIRDEHLVSRLLVQPVCRHFAELSDVHTAPDRRRRGYAASLVHGVVRRLHEKGLSATYSVHPDNTPSVALAQRCGFAPGFAWQRWRVARG
jgi:ribosomal protein S18 acetylase RimI-like enzyme